MRYGVGWDLTARNAYGSVDVEALRSTLAEDPDVVGVASAGLHKVIVDGTQLAPSLGILPISGELWPTVLDGRTPGDDVEVLVGASVLDRLGVEVGDTVRLQSETILGAVPVEFEVEIVGAAVFPSIDIPGLDPTRLDEGVAMTWERYQSMVPPDFDPIPGITFLDLADGVDPQTVITRFPWGLPQFDQGAPTEWLVSLAPAEVVDSDSAHGLIWAVIGLLGVIVVATIGHGMATTVRRRRGDYAVLKAPGFTSRQVLTAVTAQSAATVSVALLVGVPLGIVLGRWSWRLFAHDMGVIEAPVVRVVPVMIAVVIALISAAAITAGPARRVGSASPATVLRTE